MAEQSSLRLSAVFIPIRVWWNLSYDGEMRAFRWLIANLGIAMWKTPMEGGTLWTRDRPTDDQIRRYGPQTAADYRWRE